MLTVAHNAVAASNRARVDALRRLPGVEVQLLTPAWWFEEGRRIDAAPPQRAERRPPASATGPSPMARQASNWRVGRTLCTGNGTRHVYLSGLADTIRRFHPDVIDLFEEPFTLVALQALVLRNLLAPRAAFVFYSAVNVDRRWRWPYRAIEKAVLRGADGAHTPSGDVLPILEAHGLNGRPVDVIPLGVDVDRFACAKPVPLPDIPRPRIGFIGRFEPVKGLDVLLEAARRLATSASLVLAGDGSLRSTLQGQRVHVLPSVAYEQIPSLLKALDVLVLPSVTILPLHREQFGRVLAEAMAAGVPVIGSTSGAIPEVIGDAGLVVPERDPAALAVAIETVLQQSDLRQRLISTGRQRALRLFDWPNVAEQTLDLFQAALAQRRGLHALEMVRA